MRQPSGKRAPTRDRNGIRIMAPTPEAGLLLGSSMAESFRKVPSAIVSWKEGVPSELTLILGRPAYLMAREKGAMECQALGVIVLRDMGKGKLRLKVQRFFAQPRRVELSAGEWNLVVPKAAMRFGEAKAPAPDPKASEKAEPEKPLEKILADAVGVSSSDAGMHSHELVRSEGRTWNDGRHFHILNVPGVGKLVSDIDGEHLHTVSEEPMTGDMASGHVHVFGLPSGEYAKTERGGGHAHEVGVRSTARGGAHTHKIMIAGQTLETLSISEEAMALGPGQFDPPDEAEGGPVAMSFGELALDLLLEKGFRDLWDKSGPTEFEDEASVKAWAQKQMDVQSIVLSKDIFPTKEEASSWVSSHGFKAEKPEEKPNTWRFRQFPPTGCDKGTSRSKRIRRGALAILCSPKGAPAPEGEKSAPANERGRELEKKVMDRSRVKVHSRPSGFSYKLDGTMLFSFPEPVEGAAHGPKLVFMERQRLGDDAMKKAPKGAIDVAEVVRMEGGEKPEAIAKENLGSRILVLQGIKGSDRLKEVDVVLATMDPTKQAEKPGGCGCGGKG